MTISEAQQLTAAFILFVIAMTIGYDVWVVRTFGGDATISRVVGICFHRYPIVFAWVLIGVGLFIGHVHLSAW
jgi:hypothetical protein